MCIFGNTLSFSALRRKITESKDRKQAKIYRIQLQWFGTCSVAKINQQIGQKATSSS